MVKSSLSNLSMKPVISVVIASYNQEKTIRACLTSLVSQKTNLKYEIIVVDSSNNKAAEIAKSFSSKIRLIRRNKRTSWGKGRNLGISKSRGEIIAFTDTDCVVDEYWIETIYEAHKKYNVVGGRVLNGNPKNLFGWSSFFSEFYDFAGRKDRIVSNLPGCNVSYKKSIFKKYGHFLEKNWFGAYDDFEFNSHIKEKIFFCANTKISHLNRTNFLEILKHSYHMGYAGPESIERSNLPGKLILEHKFLIPLLPLYRLVRAGFATLNSNFLFFMVAFPLTFTVLVVWTYGFWRGTRVKSDK